MIRELRIKNLALIEDVLVEFEDGFSVFTGETGAGKSILVGAIGLLLGERASSEHIRSGSEEAEVNGLFDLRAISKQLSDLFAENAIADNEGACIVRRVIARNGRNRVFINQVPVPLTALKTLGDRLIDFHGQHEHQSLLDPESALRIIDRLPGIDAAAAGYGRAYAAYVKARDALSAHDKRCAELAEKRDVIEFQYGELRNLGLSEGEEAKLEDELKLMSSSAQRLECVSGINNLLAGGETAISHQIGLIKKNLETLSRFDSSALPWIRDLAAASSVFSELEAFCGQYLEKNGARVDSATLDRINDRLAKVQRLKKKYACEFEGLLEKQRQLKLDLDALVNIDADRDALKRDVRDSLDDCMKSGATLTHSRKKQAGAFDKAITLEMAKLGFSGGLWSTDFTARNEPQNFGLEDAAFSVRTNVGEEVMPLIKIASGGEMSRMMLAIKTVMAAHDHIPILIFDEIDSGIGGVLAKEVGKSLASLSATHQILCISHLHQIASLADHHYRVYKEAQGRRTVTRVEKLSGQEKVAEIARMLGGESAIAKKHAEELLEKRQ
jgi:DNA repair protein RecN (Recombination protein N)